MAYKYRCLLYISPLILLLDQLTKALVRGAIPRGGEIALIPGYVDLVHVWNTGAAFGILAGDGGGWWRHGFFFGISLAALIGIGYFVVRLPQRERLLSVVLALVVGGIVGNLVDRLAFGAVTDFFSVHWQHAVVDWELAGWRVHFPLEWPAFNVADSAITVSMVLLAWQLFRQR